MTRPTIGLKEDVAIDKKSGLIWQRCVVGTSWNKKTKRCDGEVLGLTQKEASVAVKRAGLGWRVPNVKELASLRVNTCKGPKIDTRAFPNVASSDFGEGANVWTSTTAISPETFYYLNFTDGSLDLHSEGFNQAVLLVKTK
ncbi:DUF1566 domain-containing protein [Paraburkholderia sp. MPAMCS5]|uniref:Lcl C-terminal domain-containing protein n=1 Tax=Paraburkholderia sp. MPAMCS5 TaxID=3112563 RepID=UPI002E187C49|nr:DUF1566 domain-containing protein [Paraburkholderia sp. MPAMCS5]